MYIYIFFCLVLIFCDLFFTLGWTKNIFVKKVFRYTVKKYNFYSKRLKMYTVKKLLFVLTVSSLILYGEEL